MTKHEHGVDDRHIDGGDLYRAVLNRDRERVREVVENTECQACLAMETTIIGIRIAAATPYVHPDDNEPWPVIPAPIRDRIKGRLPR